MTWCYMLSQHTFDTDSEITVRSCTNLELKFHDYSDPAINRSKNLSSLSMLNMSEKYIQNDTVGIHWQAIKAQTLFHFFL